MFVIKTISLLWASLSLRYCKLLHVFTSNLFHYSENAVLSMVDSMVSMLAKTALHADILATVLPFQSSFPFYLLSSHRHRNSITPGKLILRRVEIVPILVYVLPNQIRSSISSDQVCKFFTYTLSETPTMAYHKFRTSYDPSNRTMV